MGERYMRRVKPRSSGLKLNRRALAIVSGLDHSDDQRYWHSQTPQARLRYMEELRRMNYGDLATRRLERILKVVEREKSKIPGDRRLRG